MLPGGGLLLQLVIIQEVIDIKNIFMTSLKKIFLLKVLFLFIFSQNIVKGAFIDDESGFSGNVCRYVY